MLMPGRAAVFLLVTILLSAVVLTNLTFKSYWGRPRPVVVTEFKGPWEFVPWWDPRGECGRNCSFFSGEGATAFWTYAPAALTPPAWRPLAYVAATLFGVATSVLRMAFGGHFFTDVAAAGLVSFLVIWLCYAWIYRWPSTRRSDEQIEATLARWGWPGYRLWQRWRGREVGEIRSQPTAISPLNACPSGRNLIFAHVKPQTTSAISTDWKLHEYDPEKPA